MNKQTRKGILVFFLAATSAMLAGCTGSRALHTTALHTSDSGAPGITYYQPTLTGSDAGNPVGSILTAPATLTTSLTCVSLPKVD